MPKISKNGFNGLIIMGIERNIICGLTLKPTLPFPTSACCKQLVTGHCSLLKKKIKFLPVDWCEKQAEFFGMRILQRPIFGDDIDLVTGSILINRFFFIYGDSINQNGGKMGIYWHIHRDIPSKFWVQTMNPFARSYKETRPRNHGKKYIWDHRMGVFNATGKGGGILATQLPKPTSCNVSMMCSLKSICGVWSYPSHSHHGRTGDLFMFGPSTK